MGQGARWLCARIVLGDSGLTTHVRWSDYEVSRMSDTYTLKLQNFRSIREASIDLAPLPVVYGPNGAGKSSLIYGLLTLRNFLTNPNQNVPSLFSYPTLSLGGYNEVVSGHDTERTVLLSLSASVPGGESAITLAVGQSGGESTIDVNYPDIGGFRFGLEIPFPYHAEQTNTSELAIDQTFTDGMVTVEKIDVTWNGIAVRGNGNDPAYRERVASLLTTANLPMELARATGFVPLRRGFSTPAYSVSNVTPALATDMEVASLLATDRFLEYEVSDYLERITERRIATRTQIGTSTFTIDSIPRDGDVPVSMVNDGFGINQLAYMLTVCLYSKSKVVAIEEPEVHLHPSMVRKLVHAMADIASKHGKRFIVSTHSEVFVVSLLAQIAAGEVSVDDVSFILAEKEDGESRFTRQDAKPNGQIEGGLDSFIASELEDIAQFLGLDSEVASSS